MAGKPRSCKFTVIESPFRAELLATEVRNANYARAAMYDSIKRGETPFASHLLYPQVLNDRNTADRRRGINMNLEFIAALPKVTLAVYADLGVSEGMAAAIKHAASHGVPIEVRYLGANWEETFNARQ